MKKVLAKLPILIALCLSAEPLQGQGGRPTTARPLAAPPGGEAEGPQWIAARAAAAISDRPSVSAKLRCQAELMGFRILGAGAYFQQKTLHFSQQGRGPAQLFRLDLRLQVGDQPSTLLQVCDGEHLW